MSCSSHLEMSCLDLGKLAGSRSDHGVGDAPNSTGDIEHARTAGGHHRLDHLGSVAVGVDPRRISCATTQVHGKAVECAPVDSIAQVSSRRSAMVSEDRELNRWSVATAMYNTSSANDAISTLSRLRRMRSLER